jgi:hypothetical protein
MSGALFRCPPAETSTRTSAPVVRTHCDEPRWALARRAPKKGLQVSTQRRMSAPKPTRLCRWGITLSSGRRGPSTICVSSTSRCASPGIGPTSLPQWTLAPHAKPTRGLKRPPRLVPAEARQLHPSRPSDPQGSRLFVPAGMTTRAFRLVRPARNLNPRRRASFIDRASSPGAKK